MRGSSKIVWGQAAGPPANRDACQVALQIFRVALPSLVAAVALPALACSVSSSGGNTRARRGNADDQSGNGSDSGIRHVPWGQRLLGAPRLQTRLVLLSELGLTDTEIAQAFPGGVSGRSVRRWRQRGMARDREAARWQPVDNLCALAGYLMSDGTFDEDATVAWMRSRHPALGQRRPLELLGDGMFDDVLSAAETSLGPVTKLVTDSAGPIARAMAAQGAPSKPIAPRDGVERGSV